MVGKTKRKKGEGGGGIIFVKKGGGYVDNRKFTVIKAIVLFIRCNEF